MIKILPKVKIPNQVFLAFSGGIDSLAIAHFLKQGNKKVTLLHFNHDDEYSQQIALECNDLAKQLDLPLLIKTIDNPNVPAGVSVEDYWRKARYKWLRSFDGTVITGHHLNDAVETWVWSSLHGDGKLIPAVSGNVLRPFLITPKETFTKYCQNHNLVAVHDECNNDLDLTRNFIRNKMMPMIKKVNPGIEKVIRKKYLNMELT